MSHLIISKKNEVFLQIEAEPHVYYELADQFTFEVPGAKFMPQYRNKYWDGKIRLFNTQNGEIYVGLLDKVIQFCKDQEYTYEFVESKYYGLPFEVNKMISKEGVKDYMTSISKYAPRDYQIEGVYLSLIHISEPTRLGMISYAVFCLKKNQQPMISFGVCHYLKEKIIKDF